MTENQAPDPAQVPAGWKLAAFPVDWTPGGDWFKAWAAAWFGPDADDQYLRRAVQELLTNAPAIPAPEGGHAAVMRQALEALEGVHTGEHQGGVDEAIAALTAALAAPAPQAPVALTDVEADFLYITTPNSAGSPREMFVAGLRAAERHHGIPAPQTKEPTNDR